MNSQPLISVIISAYNEEKYVERCLESVIRQSLDDSLYEVCVYDDGSTDSTFDVIQKVSKAHGNIRVKRNEKNLGLGANRNQGIRDARGTYIAFLDADDTFDLDSLELLLAASYDGVEIVYGKLFRCYQDGREIATLSRDTNDHFKALMQWETLCGACAALYSKEFLVKNAIFFNEGLFYEDVVFSIKSAAYVKEATHIQKTCYNHFFNQNTITSSINKKKITDIIFISESVCNLLETDVMCKKYSHMAPNFLAGLLRYTGYLISTYSEDFHEDIEFFKTCIDNSDVISKHAKKITLNLPARSERNIRLTHLCKQAVVFVADADYHVRHFVPIVRKLKELSIPSLILERTELLGRPLPLEQRAHYGDIQIIRLNEENMQRHITASALAYVFPSEGPHSRPALRTLRRLGIPTFSFYEGVYDDNGLHAVLGQCLPYRISDHLFIPGDYYRNIYAKVPHSVAGLPHLRDLLKEQALFPPKTHVLINCNFSYEVLLEASEPFLHSAVAACQQAGLTYSISQHPADFADLSTYPLCGTNVYDAIRRSSILISRFSTCILEALALGKPVIYHNPHGERFPTFQQDPMGAFPVTRNSDELASALECTEREIAQGVDFRNRASAFLHHMANVACDKTPGEIAAAKIAEVIQSGHAAYVDRLSQMAEGVPLFQYGAPKKTTVNPAPAYEKTLMDSINRLKGKEVYYWGCGSLYNIKKHLFTETKPRCILDDTGVFPQDHRIDGIPVKHPKEVLRRASSDILPIIVFAQNINMVYQKIKDEFPEYSDIVFCNMI